MRRVAYKQVAMAAGTLWTGERELSQQDAEFLNVPIDRRGREFWQGHWWPEWMASELRRFRQDWLIGTTYGAATTTAGVERYFVPARKYYQSLRAGNTGNAPATLSGGSYVENSAWWAECQGSYSGDDWTTGTTYTFTAGSPRIVRNPADDRWYQLHTTHVAGGSLDGTKFGLLTGFVRSIGLEQTDANGVALTKIGEVRRVWPSDPNANRYWRRGQEVAFEALGDGIVVGGTLPEVWVEFRKRPFVWLYSAAYLVTSTFAADVYVYDDATGEVYRSLVGSNVGNAVTDTTKWERQDFPYVLADAVAQAAFADVLRTEKDTEGYVSEMGEAMRLRDVAMGLAEKQGREQMRVIH